jgi:hypothetical protein
MRIFDLQLLGDAMLELATNGLMAARILPLQKKNKHG